MFSEILGGNRLRVSFRLKIIFLFVLTALADVLFYGHQAGWVIGLYGLILSLVCVCFNQQILRTRGGWFIFILTLAQCFLQFEKTSMLCFALMCLGLISLVILAKGGWQCDGRIWARYVLSSVFLILRPLNRAFTGMQKYKQRYKTPNGAARVIRGWLLPVLLSFVFMMLFKSANPILMHWLDDFDVLYVFRKLSLNRVFFWCFIAVVVFSVIRPRRVKSRRKVIVDAYCRRNKPMSITQWLFTKESILRSLIIFNAMFAFQTLMDLHYLWGGAQLPDGISYAQYAQRGAYPLIVTALLAAVFVLISQNAGKDVSRSKLIQALVYMWVAQNILLVISAIYRNGLYVEVYALTYWRVAAFIWMGMVASGLSLIIIRSAYSKSNRWLINANIIMALSVLFVSSFMNFGTIIATYNVMHAKEIAGKGVYLDRYYLEQIGAQALPAMRYYQKHRDLQNAWSFDQDTSAIISRMEEELRNEVNDWRRWTFGDYRQQIASINLHQ